MKVLVVGPQFPDSFARNISVTLAAMGHEVTSVEESRAHHYGGRLSSLWRIYAPKALPAIERRMFREIVRATARVQPDLVLVTYSVMPPGVVDQLKGACRGKVVCWYTDSVANLHRGYLLASCFDATFVKEPFLARVMHDKLGLNASYLPECCNPIWHKPIILTAEDQRKYGCDVAAQGTLHYYRARMLEAFPGQQLRIWGTGCPAWLTSPVKPRYTNHLIAETEKAKALRAAKVVVNTMHYAEIDGVNCTLFEAAGCGAFQIADWKPTLPDLFEPEREIATFRTRQELKDKVDYYLSHPEERHEIADRAYARAHREHTYETRLRRMFEVLGLASGPAGALEVATLQAK